MSSPSRHLPPLSFAACSSLTLEQAADLYTQTFANYYYDAIVTPDHMAEYVRIEQLDLARSPVLYVGSTAVGLATVGLRGERAYCKGFGIIVPYRGKGLADALCAEVIRQARLAGARRLGLGVLQHNERAVKTYLRARLHVTRDLLSFEWQPAEAAEGAMTAVRSGEPATAGGMNCRSDRASIAPAEPAQLLDHFALLHRVTPIWGHDLPSLREMRRLKGLAMRVGANLCGYVLYEPAETGAAELLDLAALDAPHGAALLAALQAQHERIICNNEPEDSPVLAAFEATGFRQTLRRYEMEMQL